LKVPSKRTRAEDARLAKLTAICRVLPDAKRDVHGDHARFHVRRRTFAYFLNDHHGDGIVSIATKMDREEIVTLLERDPARYYSPDYIGPRGWIAFCLDVKPVDWNEARRLMVVSYRLVAPKKLAAAVEAP
jgi:predicted DNA-binding protein (MmcQ/YjbR family)